jgi:hypothetical protein
MKLWECIYIVCIGITECELHKGLGTVIHFDIPSTVAMVFHLNTVFPSNVFGFIYPQFLTI